MSLPNLSAFEMAEKIRSGELRSSDLVEAAIRRIEEINPKINAMVETRFAEARREAQVVDDLTDRNFPDKPLLGVPFTVKEMIAIEGMKSTLGSIHLKHQVKNRDATIVARMKAAGAILLGTSNVPELGFWFECQNTVYGTTNNPYDLSRTSGGSSGGEAALIAIGASPFGLGSDIGGSIRIPAGFCGIFGHKPSHVLIPFTGHTPIYYDNALEYSGHKYPLTVVGPMCRKAKDLRPLFELLMGDDGIDTEVMKSFKLAAPVKDWSKIKVYSLPYPVMHGTTETETEVGQAVENAVRYFEQLGAQVEALDPQIFLHGFSLWMAAVSQIEGRDFNVAMNPEGPTAFPQEFIKMLFGKSNYTLPALLTAFLEKHRTLEKNHGPALEELAALKVKMAEMLGENSVLLMPPHPRVAPKHGKTVLTPFDFAYTGIANALRLPASEAPLGLNSQGLPLGVQIIAGHLQDHLCFSACEELETAFGGWTPAPI